MCMFVALLMRRQIDQFEITKDRLDKHDIELEKVGETASDFRFPFSVNSNRKQINGVDCGVN